MEIDLVTKGDLEAFKIDLLNELKVMMYPKPKKWLTSKDVRKILSCSSSTLQNLRINGEISAIKLGGRLYYDYSQFEKFHSRK